MHTHKDLYSALSHPSVWAGMAGVLTSLASQLGQPYGLLCYLLAAGCSATAILLKPPVRKRVRTK